MGGRPDILRVIDGKASIYEARRVFLDLSNEMEQAADRIATLEAQLAEAQKRIDAFQWSQHCKRQGHCSALEYSNQILDVERRLAERDRQIERLRDAVEPLVKAMMHVPDDVPDLPMAVKMLGEDLYLLRAALAATTTPPETREGE